MTTTSEYPSTHDTSPDDRQDAEPGLWRRLLRSRIGKGAIASTLAATLVGGGALAYNKSRSVEARQQPPTATATLEESLAPTPTTTETEATGEWNLDNFQYLLNGKIYEGTGQLEEAYGISVDKYPTGEEAAPALIEGVNVWINSLGTKAADAKYGTYTSKDGQNVGTPAVAGDYVGPEWIRVLTASSDGEGVSPEDWTTGLIERHRQIIGNSAQTLDDAVPYYGGYKINKLNVHSTSQGVTAFTIDGTYSDNGDQNSIGVLRSGPGGYNQITTPKVVENFRLQVTMKQVAGENGKLYWRVISVQKEASTPSN